MVGFYSLFSYLIKGHGRGSFYRSCKSILFKDLHYIVNSVWPLLSDPRSVGNNLVLADWCVSCIDI